MLRRALALVFSLSVLSSLSAPVKTPHVEAELIARQTAFQPGQPIEAALRLKIIDHWHTYWRNPGDSGLPTKLTWSLPEGYTAGEIEWPYPKKLPLGPLMNFGYEGEVLHLLAIGTPATAKPGLPVSFKAKAEWLVCSDVCIPESAELTLTLPASATAAASKWDGAFTAARQLLPATVTSPQASATIGGGKLVIDLPTGTFRPSATAALTFFPLADDLIANAGKQVSGLRPGGDGITLNVPLAEGFNRPLARLEGVLVADDGWGALHPGKAIAVSLPVKRAAAGAALKSAGGAPADEMGLGLALLFALLGGLILNLMPCVFPVLGLKVMGFAQNAASGAASLKRQGLAFLAGVMLSFWILAGLLMGLRAAGEAIGWGFQLQSPPFVTLLAILFFVMALNLSGLFEAGLRLQAAAGNLDGGRSRPGLRDAFLSGVLATIVATPCTAPFMGAAMGYTLAQPAAVGMLVFSALALGMALPVLALSWVPAWLKRLPKPGAWMETFRQVLAFPLFATVVWLVWVLGSQTGNDGVARLLFGLLLVAFAAWLYGRWQMRHPLRALAAAGLIGFAGLAIAWPAASADTSSPGSGKLETGWIAFSPQKVQELRAQNTPVFVDFTATWCITCQVNKRVALNSEAVQARFAALGVVRMKADWTLKDPVITQALAEFGRNGVPLYVYYPVGGEPAVLPEVLTPSILLTAIDAAKASGAAHR